MKTNKEQLSNENVLKLVIKIVGNYASGKAQLGMTYTTICGIQFKVTVEANPFKKNKSRYYVIAEHSTFPNPMGEGKRLEDEDYQAACRFINKVNLALCDYSL
jgi:hypothetical protein